MGGNEVERRLPLWLYSTSFSSLRLGSVGPGNERNTLAIQQTI